MYWYIIGIGTSRFVLYREVFFIWSVLYWRFHCTISIFTILINFFFIHYRVVGVCQQLQERAMSVPSQTLSSCHHVTSLLQ